MTPDNFCNFPFIAVDRHHHKYAPCCINQTFNKISFSSISDYWNSTELSELRNSFLQNQRDPGCSTCWKLDDNNKPSLRLESLNRQPHDPFKITQIKLITGKTCNISCMSCFSTVSTTYENLWKNNTTWIMPDKKQKDMLYDWAADQWIRENHEQLEYIDILGGEPLFSKDFLCLLDFLVENHAAEHITLFIITNGTIVNKQLIDKIKKFKKVVFTVSIDAAGKANDYIRWGSNFDQITDNLKTLNDITDISILPTISALNVHRIHDLYDFCSKHNYTINNINLVAFWPQLDPKNLPDLLKSKVDSNFRSLVDGPGNTDSLLNFIKQWDNQRNTSIVNYMPEWAEIII
jgi:organic radical activating enzyme